MSRATTLNVHCIADLDPRSVSYLWPGRVPKGAVTLVGGPRRGGKRLFVHELIACVTYAKPWPGGAVSNERGGGNVILLKAEDDMGATKLRIEASGAFGTNVLYVRGTVARGGASGFLSLTDDLEAVTDLAKKGPACPHRRFAPHGARRRP